MPATSSGARLGWRHPTAVALAVLLVVLGISPTISAAAAKKPKPAPVPQTLLEAEYESAKDIDLYLVLRLTARRLEVRARGITLESIPFESTGVLRYREPSSSPRAESQVPTFYWTVAEDSDGSHRKLIAPAELRPYPEEDAEEEEQDAQLPVATAPAGAVATLPTPPTDYTIALDGGWQLWVTNHPPKTDLWSRLRYALRDGWARLRQHPLEAADRVVIVLPSEEAQRIQHLFRAGTRILLDSSGT